MPGFRRVLHPSDFSSASRPAFRKAMDLAKSLGGDLVLVHVLPFVVVPMMMAEGYIPAATLDDLQRTARAVAQRHLNRLVAQAKQAGVRVSSRLVEGSPVDGRIVRTAGQVAPGDPVSVLLHEGQLDCRVECTREHDDRPQV